MTPQESEVLYRSIRANVLARHFAIGRYWRRNMISEDAHLGNKMSMTCEQKIDRPQKADGTNLYETAEELINRNRNGQLLPERWRVARREHANPLLQSGMHLTQLAVEAKLGNAESLKIIDLALTTIGSLYKFKNHPVFGGYILRYDPVTCEEWYEYPKPNQPFICCKFFPNLNVDTFKDEPYTYCTPDYNSLNQDTDPARFRLWEPSFDEITGLIGAYYMIWYCLRGNSSPLAVKIVDEVKSQSDRLGMYLKEAGYILVRPHKGFSYYGCTGVGALLEIMYIRALARINNKPMDHYKSNHTFEDALKLAGVWTNFNDMISTLLLPGVEFPLRGNTLFEWLGELAVLPLTTAFDLLVQRFCGKTVRDLDTIFSTPEFRAQLPNIVINAIYVLVNYKVFKVGANSGKPEIQEGDPRLEFALGYLIRRLMMIDPKAVYKAYMTSDLAKAGFKPWLGLCSLEDEDPFYKQCYLDWANALPPYDPDNNEVLKGVTDTAFNTVVALLLGGDNTIKTKLDAQMLTMYNTLNSRYNNDLFVYDYENHEVELHDNKEFYYGFTLPLSLIWLYNSDRGSGCLGSILPWFIRVTDIPTLGSMSDWPSPKLPAEVVRSLSDFTREEGNDYEVPLEYLPLEYTKAGISTSYYRPGPGGGHPFADIDLFADPVPIPELKNVSRLPPPIVNTYTIDITQYDNDAELLAGIIAGNISEYPRTFHPPAFPDNLPQERYKLVCTPDTEDERGSSIDSDGSGSITIRLKSYAEWIEEPPGSGIYIPDVNRMQNAFYKGSFYCAWMFTY